MKLLWLNESSTTDLTKNACGEDVRPDQLRLVGQTSVKQEPGTRARLGSDRGLSLKEGAAVLGFT